MAVLLKTKMTVRGVGTPQSGKALMMKKTAQALLVKKKRMLSYQQLQCLWKQDRKPQYERHFMHSSSKMFSDTTSGVQSWNTSLSSGTKYRLKGHAKWLHKVMITSNINNTTGRSTMEMLC